MLGKARPHGAFWKRFVSQSERQSGGSTLSAATAQIVVKGKGDHRNLSNPVEWNKTSTSQMIVM